MKLICDGAEIACHKYVLSAQSEMFGAMFEHNFRENVTNQVEIQDTSHQLLTIMIDYIYTANFPPNLEQLTASPSSTYRVFQKELPSRKRNYLFSLISQLPR